MLTTAFRVNKTKVYVLCFYLPVLPTYLCLPNACTCTYIFAHDLRLRDIGGKTIGIYSDIVTARFFWIARITYKTLPGKIYHVVGTLGTIRFKQCQRMRTCWPSQKMRGGQVCCWRTLFYCDSFGYPISFHVFVDLNLFFQSYRDECCVFTIHISCGALFTWSNLQEFMMYMQYKSSLCICNKKNKWFYTIKLVLPCIRGIAHNNVLHVSSILVYHDLFLPTCSK